SSTLAATRSELLSRGPKVLRLSVTALQPAKPPRRAERHRPGASRAAGTRFVAGFRRSRPPGSSRQEGGVPRFFAVRLSSTPAPREMAIYWPSLLSSGSKLAL